jgi:hypothetical protein
MTEPGERQALGDLDALRQVLEAARASATGSGR